MPVLKLSDREAKDVLLEVWPERMKMWRQKKEKGYWIRALPASGRISSPKIRTPGTKLFSTQPDGLWVFLAGNQYCDVICIEVCGTVQNLNDKRSRYIPSNHSVLLHCPMEWLKERITVQRGRTAERWKAARSVATIDRNSSELVLPIRHLRVLYALPTVVYGKWKANFTMSGHEFFCRHSSLSAYSGGQMQEFLPRLSARAHFLTDK